MSALGMCVPGLRLVFGTSVYPRSWGGHSVILERETEMGVNIVPVVDQEERRGRARRGPGREDARHRGSERRKWGVTEVGADGRMGSDGPVNGGEARSLHHPVSGSVARPRPTGR